MKKSALLRGLTTIVACVALGWLPQNAFAQRGGHGGGGGFHGGSVGGFHSGGGHYGYGGGHSYVGYHGGYAWHGGYNGWHSDHWGYPYYGWGWGFAFGWPYWGWSWGYPYAYYGDSPWYYAPYPYYSYPYDCPPGYSCFSNGNDDPPPAKSSPKPGHTPANPWRPTEGTPNTDEGRNYRVAHTTQVQNAMRALREAEERALLRSVE